MRITFDPAKDAANVAKHGLSLAVGAELDWTLRSFGKTAGAITARCATWRSLRVDGVCCSWPIPGAADYDDSSACARRT